MPTHSSIVQALKRLDQLEQGRSPLEKALTKTELRLAIETLRWNLPAAVLNRHDRLLQRGLPSVARVEHGTCSACHRKLPSGHLNRLLHDSGLEICDYCGAFLCLEAAPADSPAPRRHRLAPRRPPRKKIARTA
ncbi:MAG TPA: C4-type zinc ribbon domain-containing protein [Chthoniobacterales bacterium]